MRAAASYLVSVVWICLLTVARAAVKLAEAAAVGTREER